MTDANKTHSHQRLLGLLLIAFIVELSAFAVLQYLTPPAYRSLWGINHKGVDQFSAALFDRSFPPLTNRGFLVAFRALQVALYVTYAAATIVLRRGAAITPAKALAIVAGAGAIAAILFPPSLSSDIYSYIAYAELWTRHLNPYFHSPQILIDVGDSVAPFLPRSPHDPAHRSIAWDIPSVYGPVWTMLSIAIVKICPSSNPWLAALGMKLLEFAALLAAAVSAGRIARLRAPEHVGDAILIVGLNPLALIEGVGSGHNDLMMVALALMAVAWIRERRPVWGGLALGFSIGVKFLTLALLPWLLIDLWNDYTREPRRLRIIAATVVGAIAPTFFCYIPFWRGFATLAALINRNAVIHHSTAIVSAHGRHAALRIGLHEHTTILILYAALTAALAMTRTRGVWVIAWTIFSAVFIYCSMGIWFPWYILWPWIVLLACEKHTPVGDALSFSSGLMGLTFSTFYTMNSSQDAYRLASLAVWLCLWASVAACYIGISAGIKNKKNNFRPCE